MYMLRDCSSRTTSTSGRRIKRHKHGEAIEFFYLHYRNTLEIIVLKRTWFYDMTKNKSKHFSFSMYITPAQVKPVCTVPIYRQFTLTFYFAIFIFLTIMSIFRLRLISATLGTVTILSIHYPRGSCSYFNRS